MRPLTLATCLAAFVAIAGCEDMAYSASNPVDAQSVPLGEGFDFYVLALSWSPSYCASFGERANKQQCEADEPFGFVVHGLWPQYESGYPTACPTDRPLSVPRSLSDSMLDIMPSTGLVRHEWREHGTCSGLTQAEYFEVTRLAFEKVAIPGSFETAGSIRTIDPERVEEAFISANPGLSGNAVAVTCDRRYVRDVRICMSRDLSTFIACPEVDANACEKEGAVMPPLH